MDKESSNAFKKVRLSYSIANKVKPIRDSLLAISEEMKAFNFVECQHEKRICGMREGQDPGGFVDPKNVIGRDKDKEAILEMILHESNDAQQDFQVIAIVGIGGMGKTTLTQLVYNHEEVKNNFEDRWFACISDTSNDKEVSGKIFQSIYKTNYVGSTLNDLHTEIIESIKGKKFLLVLDDVWDDDRVRWKKRMSLLDNGAKGSRIIVSTRSSSVARAVDASKIYNLCGLSEEDSWDLFKSVVTFIPERDSRWTDLGREFVKKCANVPLAINSIASLLIRKDTIEEWEFIRNEELPHLGHNHEDGIMPVLKLSYDHLPSNLKHCFAYCSLFPKDFVFLKEVLINLWIAQGYINPNNEKQVVEHVGHSYFMDLLRRSFFQAEDSSGVSYKMHDLIHNLAIHVAGEESIMLTTSSNRTNGARHLSVGSYDVDDSWVLSGPLHNVNRLRSFLFLANGFRCKLDLDKQFAKFKSLRTLILSNLEIDSVPDSIGGLKQLRYLDISLNNNFKEFPDSITKLVNLCTLDIRACGGLKVLPDNFRKLINLRHLYNAFCTSLKHMPPGFEELADLQHLNDFRVSKGVGADQRSKLDVLPKLKLRGKLEIRFEDDTDDWDGVECWQPPLTLQELRMHNYKGTRIPHWGNERADIPSPLPKLTSLSLYGCPRVKCLPPFRHIPNIKTLRLKIVKELEYIDEDALFIPDLELLELDSLPKLKGWSRKIVAASTSAPRLLSFPSLSYLDIIECPQFKSMLLCPRLRFMALHSVAVNVIQQLLPIRETCSPVTTSSSHLEDVSIVSCDWMADFPGKSLTSLRRLCIHNCIKLKKVDLPPSLLNNLEYLTLKSCPGLELWNEKKRGVEWNSLHKLLQLRLDRVPSSDRLPDCLRHGQELGKLQISR